MQGSILVSNTIISGLILKDKTVGSCISRNKKSSMMILFLISLFRRKQKVQKHRLFTFLYLTIIKLIMFKINSYDTSLYEDLRLCSNKTFFSIETIKQCDQINNNHLWHNLLLSVITKFYFSNHSVYYKYIILLSGDISLNPGPVQTSYPNDICDPFKNRGLHFLHLNINSLLPKIEEVRHIAKHSNAAVIGITESKLDDSVLDSEITISGFDIIMNDRNRKEGGVACYVSQNICYNLKNVFPSTVENIF